MYKLAKNRVDGKVEKVPVSIPWEHSGPLNTGKKTFM